MVGRSSQVARGLSTIAARITKSQDELAAYGIQVEDTNGNLKSTYDVLTELKPKWDAMSEAERVALGDTLAGTNQYKVLASVMSNFQTAADATATAYNSVGSAAEESSKYMESLKAQTDQLKATFQDLANNVIDSELVSSILNLANNVLKFLNTETGATIIQWGLLTGVLTGGITIFGQIGGKLINGILNFGAALKTLSTAFTTAGISVGAFATAALPVAAIVAAVGLAIYGIVKAVEEANPSLIELTDELKSNEDQIEANKARLEELNAIPWYDRTEDIRNETESIEDEIKSLEKLREELTKEQVEAAKNVVREDRTINTRGFKFDATWATGAGEGIVSDTKTYATLQEAVREAFYQATGSIIGDSNEEYANAINLLKTWGIEFEATNHKIKTSAEESDKAIIDEAQSITKAIEEAQKAGKPLSDDLLDRIDLLESTSGEVVNAYEIMGDHATDSGKNVVDAFSSMKTAQNEYVDSAKATATQEEKRKAELQEMIRQAKVYRETINMADIMSKFESDMTNAFKEVDKYGEVTSDTLSSLANTFPELISNSNAAGIALFNADGTISDVGVSALSSSSKLLAFSQEILKAEIAAKQADLSKLKDEIDSIANAALTGSAAISLLDVMTDKETESANLEDQIALLKEQLANIKPIQIASVTSDKSASKEAKDVLEELKSYLEKQEHKIYLLNKQDQEKNAQEIANIYVSLQKSVTAKANELRKQNYAEDSSEIRELQKLWWGYQDEIDSVYDAIEARQEEARKVFEENTAASLKKVAESWQNYADEITKQQEALDALSQWMQDQIDTEIDAIDSQIDALDKVNSELKDQISLEEKLDKLAKARSNQVMVYKDGRFQYVSDIDAVSEAQSDLEIYNREKELEAKKEALEAEKTILEKYKDEWSNLGSEYEKEQNRLLIYQQLGINIENDNWKARLTQAQSFVDKYTLLMKELAEAQANAEKYEEGASSGRYLQSVNGKAPSNAQVGDYIVTGGGTYLITGGTSGNWESVKVSEATKSASSSSSSSSSSSKTTSTTSKVASTATALTTAIAGSILSKLTGKKYASGTTSASGGLSLVGEEGPELRMLGQGDGILPADVTKNLWSWGMTTPSSMLSALSGIGSSVSNAMQISIGNITLSSVSNASQFVEELKGFKRYAIQYGTGL